MTPEENKAFMASLGRKLLVRRVRADLSQTQLANAVGLTRNKISALERGTQGGRLLEFLALARFYEVSLDQLVKDDR